MDRRWSVWALVALGVSCARNSETRPAEPNPSRAQVPAASRSALPSASAHPSDNAQGSSAAHHRSGHHRSGHHHAGHDSGHAHHQHSFADVERYAKHFESPERAAWQKPDAVTQLLSLSPGMHVADLGAGTGYFLPYLSRAVGETGVVLGLDVEPGMVDYMRRRIETTPLANARAQLVSPGNPQLPDNSVDRILIVDTWHHLPERVAYTRHLFAALRPGGQLLIVDFTPDSPIGPPSEFRFTPQQVLEELASGAQFRAEVLVEDLPYQFAVRAEPVK